MPWGNWYRGAISRGRSGLGVYHSECWGTGVVNNLTMDILRRIDPSQFTQYFDNSSGDDYGHYTIGTVNKLQAMRLVGSAKRSVLGLGA